MSRPLRSAPTPASRGICSYYRPVRRRAPHRYSLPSVSPRQAPSRHRGPLHPFRPASGIDARLLTFHARAADQAHAASTPGTTWPVRRVSARLIPERMTKPPVSMPLQISTRQQRHPAATLPDALERLPGPHLTRSRRAFSLTLTTRGCPEFRGTSVAARGCSGHFLIVLVGCDGHVGDFGVEGSAQSR